jgi:hypothetical protein
MTQAAKTIGMIHVQRREGQGDKPVKPVAISRCSHDSEE